MTTENANIIFAKVKPLAIIPSKIEENAGFDVYSCFDEDYILINPNETKLIPTGISSACDKEYFFQLNERGSTGVKGIGLRAGVIDSNYRGEWFVAITNHNTKPLLIAKEICVELADDYIIYPYSKAIAQAVLLPVPKVTVTETFYEDLLTIKSDRGIGKLGSSGK